MSGPKKMPTPQEIEKRYAEILSSITPETKNKFLDVFTRQSAVRSDDTYNRTVKGFLVQSVDGKRDVNWGSVPDVLQVYQGPITDIISETCGVQKMPALAEAPTEDTTTGSKRIIGRDIRRAVASGKGGGTALKSKHFQIPEAVEEEDAESAPKRRPPSEKTELDQVIADLPEGCSLQILSDRGTISAVGRYKGASFIATRDTVTDALIDFLGKLKRIEPTLCEKTTAI